MKSSDTNQTLMKTIFTGLFTAISFILYLLEFPIIPGNTALKLDLSDIAALVGAISFGPVFGVTVELLKNILELVFKGLGTQMGYGNLINFIVGCSFIVPFSLIFKYFSQKPNFAKIKANIIAGVFATACIIAAGIIVNYFVAPSFFRNFVHYEIGKEALWGFIGTASILNLIKGTILSVFAYPISQVLNKQLKHIKKK
ncbi:MAG: ECF transporter S component [Eubacteriales bacterium]